MPTDELTPSYEFIYAGGEQSAYFFLTENDIAYQVKFAPSNYLFAAHAELQIQAFEMSISVAQPIRSVGYQQISSFRPLSQLSSSIFFEHVNKLSSMYAIHSTKGNRSVLENSMRGFTHIAVCIWLN
ncbi:hypothetical protein EXU85_07110 [Spirosoma sp. KCTC 42546]|nr:hypothetical protein [Spirosoma sp. KCTC 42546]QDK78384.1 hypothetical protein EXU85_07110 [Spirosoma sp. KCTC 42546]